MQISILGTFAVTRYGEVLELGGRKQRAVLAALVLERGETVSTSTLIEIVWGDEPPGQAEASLQAYISKLCGGCSNRTGRHVRTPPCWSLVPGATHSTWPPSTSTRNGSALVATAREAQRASGTAGALAAYDEALAMWAPVLVEFEHETFTTGVRLRLTDLHADAVDARTDVQLALGAHREILGELEAGVVDAATARTPLVPVGARPVPIGTTDRGAAHDHAGV